MEIVHIQALPREGFSSRPRAGRFWPSGEAVAVEVVDGDDDPTVEVEKKDGAGKTSKVKQPHPTRISRKVYEEQILKDPVLRIVSGRDVNAELSQAALDAARKQAGDLASELVGVKASLADALERLAKANARVAELEAKAGGAVSLEMGAADTGATAATDKGGGKAKGK